jgi:hypothetical protein
LRANVPLGSLSNYIAGRNVPSAKALSQIANACRVNLHWLTQGEGQMDAASAAEPFKVVFPSGEYQRHPHTRLQPVTSLSLLAIAMRLAVFSLPDENPDHVALPAPGDIWERRAKLTLQSYDNMIASVDQIGQPDPTDPSGEQP